MTAHHFLISSTTGTRLMGHALVCPAARYASVRWRDADRLERKAVKADTWPRLVAELRDGWTKGEVAIESVTFATLVDRMEVGHLRVQKLTEAPFANDVEAARLMDDYLKAQAFA